MTSIIQDIIQKAFQECFTNGKLDPTCYREVLSGIQGMGQEVLKEIPSSRLRQRLDTVGGQIITQLETKCGPADFKGSTLAEFTTYLLNCLQQSPAVQGVKDDLILSGARVIGSRVDKYIYWFVLIFIIIFLVIFLVVILLHLFGN